MNSDPPTEGDPSASPSIPPTTGSTQATPRKEPPVERSSTWSWLRWLVLLFAVSLGVGSVAGYLAGTDQRAEDRQHNLAQTTQEQFDRGLEDLEAGRYDLARQRFEYVIRLDPTYPDAAQRLAEALLGLSEPTATPTPQATATPNLAPVEELLDQALAALAEEDWGLSIDTLVALRAKEPSYKAVEVDGLLFVALRNRGVERIANEGMLEEGMYDLSRAELFGPLDRDASNWRNWARLYLQANSYVGVNWAQAALYFSQVYLVAPYLKNDAYLKYATAAQRYADQLMDADDPCAAMEQYEASLLAWENGTLIPTATKAAASCATATARPRPTRPPPEDTPTPTPTEAADDGGSGAGD